MTNGESISLFLPLYPRAEHYARVSKQQLPANIYVCVYIYTLMIYMLMQVNLMNRELLKKSSTFFFPQL